MISPPTLRRAAIYEVLIFSTQVPEALCTRFWSLCWRGAGSWFTRFVSLPDARNPKTRSKPRKWGDAGRGRRWTPNVIHFHKKATRYWESDWAVSTKNVDFCRKRGGKNGAAPHKRGWNSQKEVKSNNTLQSLPINRNSERSYRKWYNRRDQNLVNRLPEWHWPRKCPSAGYGRDQNLVNP